MMRRIAAELRLPVRVADNQHRVGAERIVGGREGAAENRRDAEHVEEIMGHDADVHAIRFAALEQIEVHLVILDERVEGVRLRAVVVQLLNRDADRRAAGERRRFAHEHEAIAVRIRQRLQQNAVDEAEDRSVRADAERQREHGEQREPAILQQGPCAETKVAKQLVHDAFSLFETGTHASRKWYALTPCAR